jgi:hypothetical protein
MTLELEAKTLANCEPEHVEKSLACDCLHDDEREEPNHACTAVQPLRVLHESKRGCTWRTSF